LQVCAKLPFPPASIWLTLGSGVIHVLLVTFGRMTIYRDSTGRETSISNWAPRTRVNGIMTSNPIHATQGIARIPCHSHNDYWRNVALFDAIHAGCMSVEADIWLTEQSSDDLYVGHSSSSLSSMRTLQGLYIQPLLEILAQRCVLIIVVDLLPGFRTTVLLITRQKLPFSMQ
jgi:hypothetical protein